MIKKIMCTVTILLFLSSCSAYKDYSSYVDTEHETPCITEISNQATSSEDTETINAPDLFNEYNKNAKQIYCKKVSTTTWKYKIELNIPDNYNFLSISPDSSTDWQQTGIQIFDREIPDNPEIIDGIIYIAECSDGVAQNAAPDYQDKEIFTTTNGYRISILYNSATPQFILFDDIPSLCIFINTQQENQLISAFNIINSIQITEIAETTATEAQTTTYTDDENCTANSQDPLIAYTDRNVYKKDDIVVFTIETTEEEAGTGCEYTTLEFYNGENWIEIMRPPQEFGPGENYQIFTNKCAYTDNFDLGYYGVNQNGRYRLSRCCNIPQQEGVLSKICYAEFEIS